MFKIINILNPLTGGTTTTEHVWESGKALSEYMDYMGECVVAYNRKIIELPLANIFPADTDEYVVMPIPAGMDNQGWRILGQFVLGTATMIFPSPATAVAYIVGSNLLNLFLRDKDKDRFRGMGVLKAIENVNQKIAPALIGKDASYQGEIDQILRFEGHLPSSRCKSCLSTLKEDVRVRLLGHSKATWTREEMVALIQNI